MPSVLEGELQAYQACKEELLSEAEGKFVLIHDGQVLGTYDSKMDAIAEGYARLGNVPFLVKQVVRVEVPQNFVSGLILP